MRRGKKSPGYWWRASAALTCWRRSARRTVAASVAGALALLGGLWWWTDHTGLGLGEASLCLAQALGWWQRAEGITDAGEAIGEAVGGNIAVDLGTEAGGLVAFLDKMHAQSAAIAAVAAAIVSFLLADLCAFAFLRLALRLFGWFVGVGGVWFGIGLGAHSCLAGV